MRWILAASWVASPRRVLRFASSRARLTFRQVGFASALVFAGCGSIFDEPLPDAGRPCTQDVDCVPNGCCGMAGSAIHQADAPSCAMISCGGMCPVAQISCGCGVPICRDSRCSVAVASGPGCE